MVDHPRDNSTNGPRSVLHAAVLAMVFTLGCALASSWSTATPAAFWMHPWSWMPAQQLHWLPRLARLEIHLELGSERQWRNWSMRLSVAAPEMPTRAAECECM